MIENATVWFTNGKSVGVERVKFKEHGWIALRGSDGWVYYSPDVVARVVSRDDDAADV